MNNLSINVWILRQEVGLRGDVVDLDDVGGVADDTGGFYEICMTGTPRKNTGKSAERNVRGKKKWRQI